MPDSKREPKQKKSKSKSASPAETPKTGQLDIVFGGPLLFVPTVIGGNITDVEVLSPNNGHPVGAVFLPGVWFSDAELNDPQCERWPAPDSFSLLDSHSYLIELTQPSRKKIKPFPVTAIPDTNHKVKPGRRLSSDWEVAIAVKGSLSEWDSHRHSRVETGMYHGSDAPTSTMVAGMHRLTYMDVTGAEFYGASTEPKDYLNANISKGGSLVIMGEIPFHPTLLHERIAIQSLAKLAGLDLHLTTTAPTARPTHVMTHVNFCLQSVIVANSGE